MDLYGFVLGLVAIAVVWDGFRAYLEVLERSRTYVVDRIVREARPLLEALKPLLTLVRPPDPPPFLEDPPRLALDSSDSSAE